MTRTRSLRTSSFEDIPPSASNAILAELRQLLATRHHIHHTTIQFESANCELAHGCILPVRHEHR